MQKSAKIVGNFAKKLSRKTNGFIYHVKWVTKFLLLSSVMKSDNFVADGRVNSISWNGPNCWIYARYSCGLGYYHKVGDNNYFFTKEEAEKILKEKENNKK